MKICVFGDVHGNLVQFQKLTETDDFLTADLRICLGDMVGLGPYQKECLDLLCNFDHIMVLGNHEARMTKEIDDLSPEKDEGMFNQFELYRKQLKDYISLFKKLQRSFILEVGGKKIYFCHYGWSKNNMVNKDLSLNTKSLTEQFGISDDIDYVVFGHMHAPYKKTEGKIEFIDVGSLGLKNPGNYLMIYENNNKISFKRRYIKFNSDAFLKDCERLNYPRWEQLKSFSFHNGLEKKSGDVLITGGAGYIGTNVASKFVEMGYNVIVIDNFSNSNKEYISSLKNKFPTNVRIFNFDLLDTEKLEKVLSTENICGVIHLAGKKYVGESFKKEEEYYQNNVILTKNLLESIKKYGIKNFVFSSSITVYGKTDCNIVDEKHNCNPLSPYAKQKLECEKLVRDWQKATQSSAVVLRLSNPIGANCEYMFGDDPKTKEYIGVLPYIINKSNNNKKLVFNGGDHPTKDGTTIRDYIHVEDVAMAFKNALEKDDKKFSVYNIGSGKPGYSVLDILKECERSLDKKLIYCFGARKEGDASVFVSNNKSAKTNLGFKTTKKLNDMVNSQVVFQKTIKKSKY